ncbi:MAG: ester cyclase [Beijerinckiaceae bacterium]|jgi:hypothetical protein
MTANIVFPVFKSGSRAGTRRPAFWQWTEMAALRERAGPNENRGETAAIAGVSLVVRGRGVNAGPGTPHPEERRRRVSKGAAFAANIRGVLGWGGLDVAMPIWRELHDSMKMHLAIERLVEDGDTVVALLNETGRFSAPFRGLPDKAPTGKTYEIIAIEWFEFNGGKITRRWAARDSAAITRQVCE